MLKRSVKYGQYENTSADTNTNTNNNNNTKNNNNNNNMINGIEKVSIGEV